jgi:ATP sulfurylase
VRYHTYEVLKQEIDNPAIRWAYLPYSMHMAGPREAIQHMIIRKNYGEASCGAHAHAHAHACETRAARA